MKKNEILRVLMIETAVACEATTEVIMAIHKWFDNCEDVEIYGPKDDIDGREWDEFPNVYKLNFNWDKEKYEELEKSIQNVEFTTKNRIYWTPDEGFEDFGLFFTDDFLYIDSDYGLYRPFYAVKIK